MLLILAGETDESASALAVRWRDLDAQVLTPTGLSKPGWRYHLPMNGDATLVFSSLVVAGKVLPLSAVTGVLTRIGGVSDFDLPRIAPEDRAYVASEMHSFLAAWLDVLPCPVVNRATPGCLCGPDWRAGRWVSLAARLGIPVVPVTLTTAGDAKKPGTHTSVIVAGQSCFGDVDARLKDHARRISDAAHVELVELQFTGPHAGDAFIGANLLPEISDDIAAALLNRLRSPLPC